MAKSDVYKVNDIDVTIEYIRPEEPPPDIPTWEIPTSPPWTCPLCGITFATQRDLEEHIQFVHTE